MRSAARSGGGRDIRLSLREPLLAAAEPDRGRLGSGRLVPQRRLHSVQAVPQRTQLRPELVLVEIAEAEAAAGDSKAAHESIRQARELAGAQVLSKPVDAKVLMALVREPHGPGAR